MLGEPAVPRGVFEIMMLVCFGAAWPASILKSWRARSTRGKSIVFLWIVEMGYVSGILHKVFYSMDGVIVFYCINLAMVAADIALYYRNRGIERRGEPAGPRKEQP